MLNSCKTNTTIYKTISYYTLKDKSFCLINIAEWLKFLLILRVLAFISFKVPQSLYPYFP